MNGAGIEARTAGRGHRTGRGGAPQFAASSSYFYAQDLPLRLPSGLSPREKARWGGNAGRSGGKHPVPAASRRAPANPSPSPPGNARSDQKVGGCAASAGAGAGMPDNDNDDDDEDDDDIPGGLHQPSPFPPRPLPRRERALRAESWERRRLHRGRRGVRGGGARMPTCCGSIVYSAWQVVVLACGVTALFTNFWMAPQGGAQIAAPCDSAGLWVVRPSPPGTVETINSISKLWLTVRSFLQIM